MARALLIIGLLAALNLHAGGGRPILAPAPKVMLGDSSAGSRAQTAHLLTLRDPEGDTIQPGDRRPLPFSTTQTCGADCHDVRRMGRGWHFNAMLPGIPAGRKGQPWILVDAATGTQIPLSYRGWPGAYRPQQIGMTSWQFALRFGARMPGGLSADGAATRVERARWMVSGDLEVNCLVCHDASPEYDQAEYARQVAFQNFRYAPTAASGIAALTGSAKEMPDIFDYLLPFSVEDALQPKIPTVRYAASRFLPADKIAFDLAREVKTTRCYYCHSNADVEQTGSVRWKAPQDVHVARGIGCVVCHPNGLDHTMVRGYEGEGMARDDFFAASLSCRGCHLGVAGLRRNGAGVAAPEPRHAGIPPIHFEKLACTACHSGPWPGSDTRRLKNGLTHGLGEHNVNKAAGVLPHLYYPVFAQDTDGKLAPYRLVWPAFWGRLRPGTVDPLPLESVKGVLTKWKLLRAAPPDGSWPEIDDSWMAQALRRVAEESGGQPVGYIAGGKLRHLDRAGQLLVEDHPQAQPYMWPLAHDVRPASESLGAHGCEDCHSADAPIFFGNVAVDSPLDRGNWKMNRFQPKLDIAYQSRLARSWKYRPWLKAIGLAAGTLLLLVFSGYFVRAVDRVAASLAGRH